MRFSSTDTLRLTQILKSKKKVTFSKRAKFFFRQWKRNETKVVEEYCWPITRVAGRSGCGRSGTNQCAGVWV